MGKDLKGKELGQGLSQRKNGKYSARLVTNGKRVEKYFDKISEAKRWLNTAIYEKENGIAVLSDYTVDHWFYKWVNTYKKDVVSDSTYKGYVSSYEHHIKNCMGNAKLKDVRPIDCQTVLNSMYDLGLAFGTMNLARITMHALFDGAVMEEVLLKNPVTLAVKCKQRETDERRVLNVAEQNDFIEQAAKSMYYNAYGLALNTGLRSGEIGGLQWSDIDFEKKILNVNRTLLFNKKKGGFYFGSPKSKTSKRTVPLNDTALQVLRNQKITQFKLRARSKHWNTDARYSDLVFTSMNGQPTGHATFNNNILGIVTNINCDRRTVASMNESEFVEFEPMTMHTLRHTFATRSIEAGMKPNVLQKILGHSSISITMDLYVHTLEEEKANEIKKIEEKFNGNSGVKMA